MIMAEPPTDDDLRGRMTTTAYEAKMTIEDLGQKIKTTVHWQEEQKRTTVSEDLQEDRRKKRTWGNNEDHGLYG